MIGLPQSCREPAEPGSRPRNNYRNHGKMRILRKHLRGVFKDDFTLSGHDGGTDKQFGRGIARILLFSFGFRREGEGVSCIII